MQVTYTKLFRIVPDAGTKDVIALAPSGTYFIAAMPAPYRVGLADPSDSASPSVTASGTASSSTTATNTKSNSATRSLTASITASPSATMSGGASASATLTMTPTITPMIAQFEDGNILMLRGGVPGGTLSNGLTVPLTLVEINAAGE